MTKLYFRSTTNGTSGLPTDEQSTLTRTVLGADAVTLNRTLSTTKGTTQTSINLTSGAVTSQQTGYWGRFVSDILNMTSIAAQTWTYNFGHSQSSNFANFPSNGSAPVYCHCYIWRPSNSSKIATIIDGNSIGSVSEPGSANNEESGHTTFSGAAVSFQVGDVIIFEVWFRWTQTLGNALTLRWFYDGLTENTTNGASVTNHASFIDSPATLTFGAPPSAIDATSDAKNVLKPITMIKV